MTFSPRRSRRVKTAVAMVFAALAALAATRATAAPTPARSDAPAGITAGITDDAALPLPARRQVDGSLSAERVAAMTLAARRYYGFWDSGDAALARAALAPDFLDRALPPGRPQGVEGPVLASRQFRAAVPDLRVTVEEMLIVGDRVVGRLRFSGHFSGTFGAGEHARRGDGRAISFIATDIYRIDGAGRIAENWHLEDNLALLAQLGVVTP